MLPLDCDGLPHWPDCPRFVSDRLKKTIHIPAELALRDSTLIEQLIDTVFDRLGSCSVELWVRRTTATHHANTPALAEPGRSGLRLILARSLPQHLVACKNMECLE